MPVHRSDWRLLSLMLALLCYVSCCAAVFVPQARADESVVSPPVTIPFTSVPGHGHIVVRIRFDDKLTGDFLLDTGSFASLMDERFARKLGIKMQRTIRRAPVAESAVEIYDMTISRARVGDLTLRNVHMLVVPHRDVPTGGSEGVCAKEAAKDRRLHPENYQGRAEALDQRLDGILGMDYLREFALMIDFEHERITAQAYGNIQPDGLAALGMDQATVVPLTSDHRYLNAYFVPVEFGTPAGQVTENEEIDTGAENTMMTPHHADQIKVPVKLHYFAQTFYGCLPFSAGVVDTLSVSAVPVGSALVGFTRKAPENFPLLLGYDVFSRCRVLFDFPASKMYIEAIPDIERHAKPEAQYSDPLPYTPGPNGEIFLTFQFDGGKTGIFALDTGADRTVISPGLAASLNLPLAPLLDAYGVAVAYQGAPLMSGKLPVMRFGGTGIAGFDCAATSAPITVDGKAVDGILGNDFFSAFLPFIDFQKHQVTFLQGRDLDAADLEKLGVGNAAEIPIVKTDPYRFCVPVEIDQGSAIDEPFLVSTVEPATILSSHVTQAMYVKTSGSTRQMTTSLGLVSAAPLTLDEFAIAGINASGGARFSLQTDATPLPLSIIGLDLLSHYRVLFDYPHGRIYLANPAGDAPATPAAPPSAAAPAKS